MPYPFHATFYSCSMALLALALPVHQAHAQEDALNLESAPVEKAETGHSAKIIVEGAIGSANQRYLPDSLDTRRGSLDLSYSGRIGAGLRAVLSDRIDAIYPAPSGTDGPVNSLREAYLSWQPDGGDDVLEFGRINLRNGPGYGYNPTDFFRDGSLRVLTSADPFALRQNRIGSVMLRGQHLWNGGSLSVAYSPKLTDRPSSDGWNLDLGSTNNRDRALIALGTQFSQSINSQVLLYQDAGLSPAVGVNLTALISDASVVHMEWTHSNEPDLLGHAFGLPDSTASRNRFVGGITYTTLGKLSLTVEYQYNGFALDRARWSALEAMPSAQLTYLREALRRQDLAPRQAYLLYVTQKSLWLKDLDLTAYMRVNAEDQSKLAWIELRQHWPRFDLSFQLQQNIGGSSTEFGVLPDSRVTQVLGTYYF
jgi:hypothetical protein